ncbi:hypothetical protein [Xanthomonas phage Carpasina]|uniref:Uncharacterized protein n=1 Tax=Xanthomonas phage Carpasina TaxID=2163636 RepID=A0A2S1GSV2_9CAUD|nr:hypothetical protein HOT16_gp34 [Xanthomonas phage Carpasina]AWD92429.1 hypothetical protein [Xanthomonas phage Carpasina]
MTTLAYTQGSVVRRIPIGFSWTTLLFGSIPSAARCHWRFFWLCLLSNWSAIYISVFELGGKDGMMLVLAVRIFLSSIRNYELSEHVKSEGWALREPAQVFSIYSASNDWDKS